MNKVSIFILVDALGSKYLQGRSFLDDIVVTKKPVKSILGFSSGVIPSILTGKYPEEHKHWSLYFYSPQTSPFKWTKILSLLPKKIFNSRVSRKIVEEFSKRTMGYSGYFETYLIPVEQLRFFDICEKKNIYDSDGIRASESIFDILKKNGIEYQSLTYPLNDSSIILKAKTRLQGKQGGVYFLYLSEFDGFLHSSCNDKEKVFDRVSFYEQEIRSIFNTAKENFNEVNMYIFSDHGMASIDRGFDLKREIDNLGLKVPDDYVAFYDSTMARFWFFDFEAKNKIRQLLLEKQYGRIIQARESEELGINFVDNRYGDLIFLMKTGNIINPSFMGNKVPQGMHGFDINDSSMDAVLMSTIEIKQQIKDVKDFFQLMLQESDNSSNCLIAKPQLKKRKKVLYFLNSVVRAGVEEHVLRLIEGLDKKQFDPVLVCPQELIDLMSYDLVMLQIRYYPIYIKRWRNLAEIFKFLKILGFEKPDIVHSHLFFATRFAAPLAKLARVPIVIDTSHLREAWRKGIKKLFVIDRFFYRFVDQIIAVSESVKEYLIKEKKLRNKKIIVVHNGIDIKNFKFSEKFQNNGYFKVGVIGRLEPQKGHKYFLEAIRLLRNKFEKVKFIIVGEGSLKSELEETAVRLGIINKVEFFGYRKDITSVLSELDILVLPSLYEGLPLVVLEAGAAGKPAIVTNVDGSPEVVINRKTGLIIPAGDALAIKNAIEELLNNPDLVIELGRNAREHIAANFDIQKQVQETEKIYNTLLNA